MPRSTGWQLLITFVPAFTVLTVAFIISGQSGAEFRNLSNEGRILSNLGIILWCVSATVCFFTYITLRSCQPVPDNRFLFCSGLFSSYLLVDDFFQLHEYYLPLYFGFNEKVVLIILIISAVIYLLYFRKIILNTNYLILMLALLFLAASATSDGIFSPMEIVYGIIVIVTGTTIFLYVFNSSLIAEFSGILVLIAVLCIMFIIIQPGVEHSEYIFEDSSKWLGIATWTSYYINTSFQYIRASVKER